jgi:hypothetical protein
VPARQRAGRRSSDPVAPDGLFHVLAQPSRHSVGSGSLRVMHTLLTKRRAVDLCRVDSSLCLAR